MSAEMMLSKVPVIVRKHADHVTKFRLPRIANINVTK